MRIARAIFGTIGYLEVVDMQFKGLLLCLLLVSASALSETLFLPGFALHEYLR